MWLTYGNRLSRSFIIFSVCKKKLAIRLLCVLIATKYYVLLKF